MLFIVKMTDLYMVYIILFTAHITHLIVCSSQKKHTFFLLRINYTIDAALLQKYVPRKTQLDIWNNTCYVSLNVFMFQSLKLLEVPIPFHREL